MRYIAIALAVIIILGLAVGTLGSVSAFSANTPKPVFALNTNHNVTSLRLMTYNIHRGIGKNGEFSLASTADTIAKAGPDIVALQEVERFSLRTGFKDEIRYLSSKLGMTYAYGKSLNIVTGQYGNSLLSKYPIEEYSTIKLPSLKEQRTVLRAVIDIDSHRLAVYNVHLGLNENERKEQVAYIVNLLSSEKLDYVLLGDMNSSVDKISAFTNVMKDSVEGSGKYSQGTIEENNTWKRIDYIFLSKNLKPKNYDVILSDASDHLPVVSEIVITK